ncbi:MAG1430 family protein [Mycoplasma hafezii]|uniref:MAG1430 family protein n=1 Tax=Mycoplasma hafezii TaxID=525886 RepID=UPI003CE862AC
MKKSMKLALWALLGTAGVATIITSSVFIAKKKVVTKESDEYLEKLAQGFDLYPGEKLQPNLSQTLASKYIDAKNRIYTTSLSSFKDEYNWMQTFMPSNIKTLDQLKEQDLYIVNPKNGSLLNVMREGAYYTNSKTAEVKQYPEFKIYFNSYANDLEGKLYILLTIKRSKEYGQNSTEVVHQIYELDGFAKLLNDNGTINEANAALYLDSANLNIILKTHDTVNYPDYQTLTSAYDKAKTSISAKSDFINGIFSISTNSLNIIDYKNAELTFKEVPNGAEINVSIPVKLAISAATKEDLKHIDTAMTKTISQTFTYKFAK